MEFPFVREIMETASQFGKVRMSKTRVLAAVGAVAVGAAAILPLGPSLYQHHDQHSAVSLSSLSDSAYMQDTPAIKRFVVKNVRTNTEQTYVVKTGDSLSVVAKLYHTSWKGLYCFNRKRIGVSPDSLPVGTKLVIKTAFCKLPAPTPVVQHNSQPAPVSQPQPNPVPNSGSGPYYSCSQLETLWVDNGGPASVEVIAASIAMAESGGYEYATEPVTKAAGFWQILGQVVPGNIYDPTVNAENAVKKYNDAGGFSPWTTYTSGAYAGRC
jgi:hypothetical protein